MNDAELGQAVRELNACIDEAVHYINVGQECFIVSVGAFEIRFDMAKLGKPETKGEAK
jgi:hypothetical protein